MAWRVQSLSEDSVDSYTHTWSVAFLILLTFLTLGISMTQYGETKSSVDSPGKYSAACWCPAQFEQSQVTYANKHCTAAFNAGMTHRISYDHVPRRIDDRKPHKDNADKEKNDNTQRTKVWTMIQRTPVILFVLAICLRLPKMLWAILSTCNGCVNLDQTLLSAKAGDSMDQESRRQLHAGLVKAFLDYVRASKMSSCAYILMKIAMIVVIFAEIIVVAHYVLPTLDDEMKEEVNNSTNKDMSDLGDSTVQHCFFQIRHMNNVHDYTVQCIFEKQTGTSMLEIMSNASSGVFMSVLTLLVILAVANVLNTAMWLVNLCGQSSRGRMGLRNSAPLDLLLLLQMARTNLSVGVAMGLADIAAVNSGNVHNEEELLEK